MLKGEDVVFSGPVFSVAIRHTQHGRRDVVVHPGAVAICANDPTGRVLLVRQHREGARGPLWEIPAGLLERGEKPLAAAKRELGEETGVTAGRWRYLGTIYPTPGYSTERTHLFLASDLQDTPGAHAEVDEARFFTAEEIRHLARSGRGDAKTLAALALAGQLGSTPRSPSEEGSGTTA